MKKILLIALLAVLVLTGCKDGKLMAPQASGRPYEVLVVMDGDLWEESTGRALFDVLDTDIPGLPQPERSFHISQCSPKDLNRALNLFRNIILVDINPKLYTKTKMKFARDQYAEGQIILKINSPNNADFAEFVTMHSQDIIDFFTKTEINRLCKELKTSYNTATYEKAMRLFGCEFHAPKELRNQKEGKDFLWTSNNTASGMMNMCIYSYPYEGPQIFNKQYLLHKRDSVMAVNIPGSEPDMYMQTDTLFTDIKPIVVHHAYAMEIRGLWQMRNDAMGGPFVSHARVDTKNNRVVVVEGFVFAPEKMKRGLIRRLEGALYTLMLPEEQATEDEVEVDSIDNK